MSLPVRPIRIDEVQVLQDFLRDHWSAEHAFVRSRELLLWQHSANPFQQGSRYAAEELSFLGAWDGSSLVAVLGEIPLEFTFRGRVLPGSWLALWKNRAERQHASAGIQLFHRVTSGPTAFVGGIGINERVRRAYGLFRFRLFEDLPSYVVLNPDVRSALVCRKPGFTEAAGARLLEREPAAPPVPGFRVEAGPVGAGEWDAFWCGTRNGLVGTDRSFPYLRWRYLTHPVYEYQWLRVYDERDGLVAAGVYRVENAAGERVLHVVEFLGGMAGGVVLARALCAAMHAHAASFLSFRCARTASFDPWRAVAGGVYGSGDVAYEIPSLFQPVVPTYRSLVWGYRLGRGVGPVAPGDCYVTRSDGDQDRPSRIDGPVRHVE
jgi:hypothetical protein